MPHSNGALAALVTSFEEKRVEIVQWKPDTSVIDKFRNPNAPTIDEVDNGGEALPPPPFTRPLPCLRGTDYGQPCPDGWAETFLGECKPPEGYIFSQNCLLKTGGKHSFSSWMKSDQKRQMELACSVAWPCANQKYGRVPDYDRVCPVHWVDQPDGTCGAPASYDGPCKRIQNFLAFTHGMKATWAANCEASWPLVPEKPWEPPKPIDRTDPSWAVWARCGRDYSYPCPMTFRQDDKGVCHAPNDVVDDFKGMPYNCSHFDTYRWTPDMKEAFSKHCHVAWPCVDHVVYQLSSAALLGLTFL